MQLYLSSFGAVGDGVANDAAALRACFTKASGCAPVIVTIEPGTYLVDSAESIPLCSHLFVRAEGATFVFPQDLGDAPCRRMFYGEDLTDVCWQGGTLSDMYTIPSGMTIPGNLLPIQAAFRFIPPTRAMLKTFESGM